MGLSAFKFAIFFTLFGISIGQTVPGQRQSPINVETEYLKSAFMPLLNFNKGYFIEPKNLKMRSDGHSIVLTADQSITPAISGGPLETEYTLHSMHFHWGSENYKGSEHRIDGRMYPMEIHAVHVKNGMDFEEAKKLSDGISVIGYLVEICRPSFCINDRNVEFFNLITENFDKLNINQTDITLPRTMSLKNIIVPFRDQFVTYLGSLTTPNYDEAVVWLLSPYTVKITADQLNAFRGLLDKGLVDSNDNFREPQPLFGRTVYFARCKENNPLLDNMYFRPFYNDGWNQYRYNNLYKFLLFDDPYYDLDAGLNVHPEALKAADVTFLPNDHIYYFNDYISKGRHHKGNVKFVSYNNVRHPVYFDDDLTYGVDMYGLLGKNHISINRRPEFHQGYYHGKRP